MAEKKVGLTLGGGGARGFAHIGVYEVLLKHNIPIHFITGCSMGSIVGAGIAQGKSPKELLQIAHGFSSEKAVTLKNISLARGSIFSGKKILKNLKKLIPEYLEFKDLKIPLNTNAVNIESGEQVIFESGNVLEAVLASSSIPGIYPPIFKDDKLFVDGGVVNSIPVDICRGMGADVIIAVDLKSYVSQQNMSGLIYHFYIQKDKEDTLDIEVKKNYLKELKLKLAFPINIMMRAIGISERKGAERILAKINPEFVIHPQVQQYGLLDFEHYIEIYKEGKRVAEEMIPAIKKELGIK